MEQRRRADVASAGCCDSCIPTEHGSSQGVANARPEPLERVLLLAHVLKDHVHGVHCACAAESDEVVVVVFVTSLWQRLLVVFEVPMLP